MAKRTEIYIGDGEIQAAAWRETESGNRLMGFFRKPLPEGCFACGKISDRNRLAEAVRRFSGECGFPVKRAGLVLDTEGIPSKILEVPAKLKPGEILYAVRGEFGLPKDKGPYVYDFCGIRSWRDPQKDRTAAVRTVLGYGMERELIRELDAVFRDAGIRILRIRAASGCVIRMAEKREDFKAGTGILCVLSGQSSSMYLFSVGACIMQGRSRLLRERGSQKMMEELAGRIGAVRKSVRERGIPAQEDYIFFGGLEPGEAEACLKIEKTTGIRTAVLSPDPGTGEEEVPAGMSFCLAAAMHRGTGKEEDLLAASRKRQVTSLEKRWGWSPWLSAALAPVLLVLAVCVFVEAGNNRLSEKIRQAESFTANEEIRAEYREVLADMEAAERYRSICRQMEELEQEQENAASLDSGLFLTVMEPGEGITCSDFRYSQADGSFSFRGEAEDSHVIHEFIGRLRENGRFGEVFYDGYSYDPESGRYRFNVSCRLNGEGGEGHVSVQ